MIYAFTGQPGAGKTLNAIKFVLEDKAFKDTERQVYYFGIKGLNIPDWIELTKEEVINWYDLPDNSIIFVDECQDIWRTRPPSRPVPETIQRLEKHRHNGFDFVLTFQFANQVDVVLRNLVTDHYHLTRAMGLNATTSYKWDYLCLNTKSPKERELAVSKTVPFDKKIYGLYHSASMHTAVKRIPKTAYLIIPLAILLVFMISKLYQMYRGFASGEAVFTSETSQSQEQGGAILSNLPSAKPVTKESLTLSSYLSKFVPRVQNYPASAPIYDEVRKVVTFPRENCVLWTEPRENITQCRCYSQQATRMDIDRNTCIKYVTDTLPFDYTRPDRDRESLSSDRESASQARGAAELPFIY